MFRRLLISALLALPVLSGAGATRSQPARGPLVVSGRWPECTNVKTWMRDVMRLAGVENASETARGKAFFEWLRLFNRMATGGMIQAFEGPYAREGPVVDVHKNLFVYGWGFCDTHSRIAEAVWQEYTGDPASAERVITMHDNGGYHTMYRLRLDGHYGAFDARYGYYLVDRDSPDGRVLDWREVGVDANILRNKAFRYRSRPFFEFFGLEWDRALAVNECYYRDEPAWEAAGRPVECVFGDGMYRMGTPYHDMDFRLAKGTSIERHWDNSARMFYVPAGARARREEPFLPSGRFYRVTETMFDGNWPRYDPNYEKAKPYLAAVPRDEGYNAQVAGGRTIGQAWGTIRYVPVLTHPDVLEALTEVSNLKWSAESPHLRLADAGRPGQATLDFRSPYVLVEGVLEGELRGAARLEIRALQAKPLNEAEPDVWSDWQPLRQGPGKFRAPLGRVRHNGRDVSIHGAYRFQLRLSVDPASGTDAAGLAALRLEAWFECGIMSIPQIFAGANTIRFKLRDAAALRGPVTVTYRYETAEGERSHRRVLSTADFRGNEAVYDLDAPGLLRCKSLLIEH